MKKHRVGLTFVTWYCRIDNKATLNLEKKNLRNLTLLSASEPKMIFYEITHAVAFTVMVAFVDTTTSL